MGYFKKLVWKNNKHFTFFNELVRREWYLQTNGTLLGSLWPFVTPFLYCLVIVTVVKLGLKVNSTASSQQEVWLLSGLLPWVYFSSCLNNGVSIIRRYDFLIKKTKAKTSLLFFVPLCIYLAPFMVFFFALILYVSTYLQAEIADGLMLFFAFVALVLLTLNLLVIAAVLNCFFRDVSKIVLLVSQFGLWVTPIIWNPHNLPGEYSFIVEFNPIAGIVCMFREAILGLPSLSSNFYLGWFLLLTMLLAFWLEKKTRDHIVEVL